MLLVIQLMENSEAPHAFSLLCENCLKLTNTHSFTTSSSCLNSESFQLLWKKKVFCPLVLVVAITNFYYCFSHLDAWFRCCWFALMNGLHYEPKLKLNSYGRHCLVWTKSSVLVCSCLTRISVLVWG